MTLENFVNFITNPSLFPSKIHSNSSLELCGRKMICVAVHEQAEPSNVLLRRVRDGRIETNVLEKKPAMDIERDLWVWATHKVRYGELNAVPLLLNDVDPLTPNRQKQEITLFIPDYGAIHHSFLPNLSDVFDKDLLGLSVLSTLCSLSLTRMDLNEIQNISHQLWTNYVNIFLQPEKT